MIQIVLVGLGAGAAAALPVCFRRVGIAGGGLSVLSRAAADHDRRARLEPLAGLIAAASAAALAIGIISGVVLRRRLGHRVRSLVARLSVNAGAADRQWWRRRRWNGIRSAAWCCGRHHRHPDRGRRRFPISAPTRKASRPRCARPTSAFCAIQALIDVLVVAVPPAAAVFSTITNVFNLWLAARVVKISGKPEAALARSGSLDDADHPHRRCSRPRSRARSCPISPACCPAYWPQAC